MFIAGTEDERKGMKIRGKFKKAVPRLQFTPTL
jgi:hypothetical protein